MIFGCLLRSRGSVCVRQGHFRRGIHSIDKKAVFVRPERDKRVAKAVSKCRMDSKPEDFAVDDEVDCQRVEERPQCEGEAGAPQTARTPERPIAAGRCTSGVGAGIRHEGISQQAA